jgi:chemotaxis protein MotA
VLGIIVTMGSLDAGPEEIGHHIAAALVGTFLGVLLSYGILNPVATNIEVQGAAAAKYLRCIKDGVVASQRGTSPIVAVEFARKAIFGSARPSSDELDEAVRSVKAS